VRDRPPEAHTCQTIPACRTPKVRPVGTTHVRFLESSRWCVYPLFPRMAMPIYSHCSVRITSTCFYLFQIPRALASESRKLLAATFWWGKIGAPHRDSRSQSGTRAEVEFGTSRCVSNSTSMQTIGYKGTFLHRRTSAFAHLRTSTQILGRVLDSQNMNR
jgi:hypothetical protein